MNNETVRFPFIKEIQQEFNRIYPFLKIDFLKKLSYPVLAEKDGLSIEQKTEMAKELLMGEIGISDKMTVLELEIFLQNQLGLSTQILRKSGNLWLKTSMTENWTLKQQNDHGMEIDESFNSPLADSGDGLP